MAISASSRRFHNLRFWIPSAAIRPLRLLIRSPVHSDCSSDSSPFDGRSLQSSRLSGTGSAQNEYLWIDDMPLAMVTDIDAATSNLSYVHPDHLHRPTKMTDRSQAVAWDAFYWPFG